MRKTLGKFSFVSGQGMLRCGRSDVYIKPECVCSFHHVYEASMYHQYSSCPYGEESDDVTQLKCTFTIDKKSDIINSKCLGD